MEPNPPIHILLFEDREEEGGHVEDLLKGHGLEFDLRRAGDFSLLHRDLAGAQWDILLARSSQLDSDASGAIEMAQELAPGLPCIVVPRDDRKVASGLLAGSDETWAGLASAIQRKVYDRRLRGAIDQAQARLESVEGRLKAIAAATLDGIVITDAGGMIACWNQSAERIFGYSETEAMGSDWSLLLVPERFQGAIRTELAKLLEAAEGWGVGKALQLDTRRKDGTEFPIQLTLALLRQGEAWCTLAIVRDLTSQRDQEREQFEHLQFLRTLIETLPNPLYYEDQEGQVLGCNRAFQEFLDLPMAEVIGRKTEDLLAGAVDDGSETFEPNFLSHHDACDTSFHMPLPDGRIRHAIFRKAPTWDADGQPQGYVATILDITKLKVTEEALRKNESLFNAINRNVIDLIAIIDGTGHRIYTSPSYQFVLGFSQEEMAGFSSMDLLHPSDLDRVTKALNGILEGKPIQGLEYRLRHKDGRWLYFESRASIIPDPESGSVRALVVARDITERKEAEQKRSAMEVQLRHAQKLEAIGQLAAGIAHEINTPTQFIGDNTAFLREASEDVFALIDRLFSRLTAIAATSGEGAEDARAALTDLEEMDLVYLREEVPKAIHQSLDGVGRISRIVKAMKEFSHPGGDARSLTDLHQAIESTITVSRNEWKYVANVVTDLDPNLPLVPCFPSEFNQVILNLIVNAAHAIESAMASQGPDAKGQITIRTRAGTDEVEVSISDNGTGIPEAVQARMFEPFYTTKAVGKGTGQGLAIAHAVIVDKHQGRIDVQSEMGRGTTFSIHIPLKTAGMKGGEA